MKNMIKKSFSKTSVFGKITLDLNLGIIALVAVIGFSMAACNKNEFKAEPLGNSKSMWITEYTGSNSEVCIPEQIRRLPVTGIERGAFAGRQLTSVIIPDCVTIIGDRAFENNQLTSVVIPDHVTVIADRAFRSNQLTSITIPDSVAIGEFAFFGNPLTCITIGANVQTINHSSFGVSFERAYNSNQRAAGTYTRPSAANGAVWTRQ